MSAQKVCDRTPRDAPTDLTRAPNCDTTSIQRANSYKADVRWTIKLKVADTWVSVCGSTGTVEPVANVTLCDLGLFTHS